jgi:DNA-binding LacI/PurR family transcriptional regulator
VENKNKKVTIRDIAEAANVSKSLVALALNDKYGVSAETSSQILLTAHKLGYDFSKTKKKVKSNNKITVLTAKDSLPGSFWDEIFLGIENTAREKRVAIDLVTYDEEKDELEAVISRIVQSCTSAIMVVFRCENRLLDSLSEFNLPILLVEPQIYFDLKYSQLRSTNYNGGYETAKYLIEKGHKRLAFVGNLNHSLNFRQRFNGFADCIAAHKDVSLIRFTENHSSNDLFERDVDNAEDLIAAMHSDSPPTALFCANDVLAVKYIKLLKEQSFNIPDDISVIGFDNGLEGIMQSPKLTTNHTEKREIGRQAVEILLGNYTGREVVKITEIATSIIERESVKNLNELR